MSVRPITLRPVSPPGSTRLSSASTLTPVELELGDLIGDVDVDLALDVHETLVLGHERGVELGLGRLVEAEHGRQRAYRSFRIGDELRVDAHRCRRDRDRQFLTVAVEDRAAVGDQLDLAGPLVGTCLPE